MSKPLPADLVNIIEKQLQTMKPKEIAELNNVDYFTVHSIKFRMKQRKEPQIKHQDSTIFNVDQFENWVV